MEWRPSRGDRAAKATRLARRGGASSTLLTALAAIVIVVIIAAAVLVPALTSGGTITLSPNLGGSSQASSQNATSSSILSQGVLSTSVEPNGSLLLSKAWGPWVYDVLVNSTSVSVGGALLVSGTLTYLGQVNTTIDEAEPINSLSVYNSTGGLAWEYTPGGINFEATITPGETLGSPVCIPVTIVPPVPSGQNHGCEDPFGQQPLPGLYSIEAEPGFFSSTGHQDLGSNLQITANFTIT
jgi:hypothetical protein